MTEYYNLNVSYDDWDRFIQLVITQCELTKPLSNYELSNVLSKNFNIVDRTFVGLNSRATIAFLDEQSAMIWKLKYV